MYTVFHSHPPCLAFSLFLFLATSTRTNVVCITPMWLSPRDRNTTQRNIGAATVVISTTVTSSRSLPTPSLLPCGTNGCFYEPLLRRAFSRHSPSLSPPFFFFLSVHLHCARRSKEGDVPKRYYLSRKTIL